MENENEHPRNANDGDVKKLRYTVSEACEALRIGRTHLYRRISEGKLTPIKDGRKTLFSAREVEAYAEGVK